MTRRGPKPARTVANDLRMIANYCKRLDPIVERITPEEIDALSEEDLWFLYHWAGCTGGGLENLALSCREVDTQRLQADDRRGRVL